MVSIVPHDIDYVCNISSPTLFLLHHMPYVYLLRCHMSEWKVVGSILAIYLENCLNKVSTRTLLVKIFGFVNRPSCADLGHTYLRKKNNSSVNLD